MNPLKPRENTLDAYAGDIVMCRNGHPLYELLEDVSPGGVMSSKMFKPIDDAQRPGFAVPINPCHICGQIWVTRGPRGGWMLCKVRTKFGHDLVEATIRNRMHALADQMSKGMYFDDTAPPLTRWQKIYGRWRARWWRVRDAWFVLRGKVNIE